MRPYGETFKDKAVARLPTSENAPLDVVSREAGFETGTLERWFAQAQSKCSAVGAAGLVCTAGARLDALIT